MCGIVGMVATFENGFTYKHKDVFSNLLWLDTLRGDDSTGIFGVNKYGNVKYAKDIKNGPQFLETTECKDILSDIYLNGRCIVGHNRKATRGFITDENAHPFVEGDKILVHNGTLVNHKELTENKVEVDSHAILHSIVERGYQKTFEEIQGAFALAWYDTKEKKLHLARNSERPLWIANTPGAWIFASEKEMLEFVLERNKIEVKDYTELTPGTVYSIEMTTMPELKSEEVKLWEPPKQEPQKNILRLEDFQAKKSIAGPSKFSKEHFKVGFRISLELEHLKILDKPSSAEKYAIAYGKWYMDDHVPVRIYLTEDEYDYILEAGEELITAEIQIVYSKENTVGLVCKDPDEYEPIFDVNGNEVILDEYMLYDNKCDLCGKEVELEDIPNSTWKNKRTKKGRRLVCQHCIAKRKSHAKNTTVQTLQ